MRLEEGRDGGGRKRRSGGRLSTADVFRRVGGGGGRGVLAFLSRSPSHPFLRGGGGYLSRSRMLTSSLSFPACKQ